MVSAGGLHPFGRANIALHLKETEMKNAVVWSEIAVADLKRATAFYEKLLDGKLKAETFGPYEIALFPHAADGIGGCPIRGGGGKPPGRGAGAYLPPRPPPPPPPTPPPPPAPRAW